MATVSLIALLVCIVVAFIKKINAGILAIPLAFIVGVYMMDMSSKEVIAGFPTSLVFTLLGIMFILCSWKFPRSRSVQNSSLSS